MDVKTDATANRKKSKTPRCTRGVFFRFCLEKKKIFLFGGAAERRCVMSRKGGGAPEVSKTFLLKKSSPMSLSEMTDSWREIQLRELQANVQRGRKSFFSARSLSWGECACKNPLGFYQASGGWAMSQEGEFFANEPQQQNSQGQNGQQGNASTTKSVGIDPRIACSAQTQRSAYFVQSGPPKFYMPF